MLAGPMLQTFAEQDVPLSATQREQLGAAYVSVYAGGHDEPAQGNQVDGGAGKPADDVDYMAHRNQRILAAARGFLTAEQIAIMDKQFAQQVETERIMTQINQNPQQPNPGP